MQQKGNRRVYSSSLNHNFIPNPNMDDTSSWIHRPPRHANNAKPSECLPVTVIPNNRDQKKEPCFQFVLWESSSLLASSSFSVSCALSCFFPLTGLYSNKSLVTHTAVFLWVSQANFDTLIMPSLSVSLPSPSCRLSPSFGRDLPASPAAARWAVQYITAKSCLSRWGAWGERPAGQRSNQGYRPISVQRLALWTWSEVSVFRQETHVRQPPMLPNLLSPCYLMAGLCVFPNLFPASSLQVRAAQGMLGAHDRRKKRGRDWGRCLWQCGGSNEGPYDGGTISKARVHSPLKHTYTQNSEGVMAWQRPGASRWHIHIHHTLHGE